MELEPEAARLFKLAADQGLAPAQTNLANLYRDGRGGLPKDDRPAGQAAAQTFELRRAVASGQKLRLDFLFSLNPDCTSMGFATVRVLEEPKHGKITVDEGTGFTNFPQNNQRYQCNKTRSDGVVIVYEPESGFVGTDSIDIDAIYASGSSQKRHYAIEVK
jgi:hypothetical protein